jgi:hypothetical protein
MLTGLPSVPRGKDCSSSTRLLLLAATMHARAALARSSSIATGPLTSRCIKAMAAKNPLCYALSRRFGNGLNYCGRFNFLTTRGPGLGDALGQTRPIGDVRGRSS